jgi:hypothetical protein
MATLASKCPLNLGGVRFFDLACFISNALLIQAIGPFLDYTQEVRKWQMKDLKSHATNWAPLSVVMLTLQGQVQ